MTLATKKDFEVTWFSGTGSGGSHRNKHANCCRIKHIETGVIVTGQSNKSQVANKKEACENLLSNWKFKIFLNQKIQEIESGITIQESAERIAEELMSEENIVFVDSEKDFKLMTKGKKKEIIEGCEVWS